MRPACPECGAIQWGNATCATCRSHWPDEPDCHEGNLGANIAGGRYPSAATKPRLTFKENVVMRLIGLVILVAPKAGVRFLASVTEGVIEKIGESRV